MKDVPLKIKMEEAKQIYFMDEFRAFMRKMQGLTDEDFKEPVPRFKEKILKSLEILEYPRRCCKRSSYMAIEKAVHFLRNQGFEKIASREIECQWAAKNKMCLGIKCLYFPKKGGH